MIQSAAAQQFLMSHSDMLIEESDTVDENSLESTPSTPAHENKASDMLIEESDTVDENSLESTPASTPVPQHTVKKIVKYTSDGKLASNTN
jgi:hypothetical protein